MKRIVSLLLASGLLLLFTLPAPAIDIVQVEYFIDEDPGVGEGIELELDPGEEVSISETIDLEGLDNGFHVLYVRAAQEIEDQEEEACWSHIFVQPFYKLSFDPENLTDVVYAEYFIDEDPGIGEADELELEAGTDVVIDNTIDLGELDNGFHVLYVRAAQDGEDDELHWSHIYTHPFLKFSLDPENLTDVVYAEYFFDEDPGLGEAMEFEIEEDTDVVVEDRLDIDELDEGDHVLYVRGAQVDENDDLLWSHTFVQPFFRRDTNTVPEWTDVPEAVEGDEEEPIEFSVSGEDPEDDPLTITASSDDLTEGWEFTDNDDGSGDFSWTPTFDDSGDYTLTLTLWDGELEDVAEVQITVNDVNRRPEIRNPIGDELETEEDEGRFDIADLDEVFFDPDEDNELSFDFMTADDEPVPEFLNMDIDDDNVLYIDPDENSNLGDGFVEVEVIADDGVGEMVAVSFGIRTASVHMGVPRLARKSGFSMDAAPLSAGPVRSQRLVTDERAGIFKGRINRSPRRDDTVSDFFTLYVTPVNDLPTIEVDPEELEVREGDVAEVTVTADDVDLDWEGDELTINIIDNGGIGDLEVEEAGEDSVLVRWQTDHDDAGEYEIVLEAEDSHEATAQSSARILVVNVDRPPEVRSPIGDEVETEEDAGRFDIADLDTVFLDPDDDELVFGAVDSPEELQVELNEEDNVLSIQPIEDFWTQGQGLMVVVTATDPEEEAAQDTFYVVVTPVNDPPEPFNLLTPEDGYEVQYDPDSLGTLDFTWQVAEQNEYEIDTVNYFIDFWVDEAPDTFRVGPLDSTALLEFPIQDLADTLGLERWGPITFNWQVWAVDSEDSTLANEVPWTFTIPALGVAQDLRFPVPDHFYLSPNFPNPFNASTTIRFGLPVSGVVELTVWDVVGRKVDTLVSGGYSAGSYEVVWNAGNISAGIYLTRMASKDFSAVRKVILVK